MRLNVKSPLVLGLLFVLTGSSLLFAQQSNNDFVEGEIYVKVKNKKSTRGFFKRSSSVNISREIPEIKQKLENEKTKIEKATQPFYKSKNDRLNSVYRLKVNSELELDEAIKELRADPEIEYVERVRRRKVIATPNDTLYADLWHLEKIKASQAWDANPGGPDIIVAVVDNAIQVNHQDLQGNMVAGRDVAENDNDPSPPNDIFSHGTHVAGIVAAVNNNVTGISSASNNKVKLMPIKSTFDASDHRFIDRGFEGIEWAIDNGADIISLSWGGPGFSQLEQDVIDDAYNNGILVIAAAGNEDSDEAQYPASYNHVISVASLDQSDERSYFSSYGPLVDIAAPGRFILSTIPTNDYASFSGTSMATPLVAASAGYLLSCFPSLSPDSVEIILEKTVDNIDAQNPDYLGQLGSGRLNLLNAVACKGSNLFDQNPAALESTFFCEGDSVQLSVTPVESETFQWIRNGNVESTSSTFYAKNEGAYILRRVSGTCLLDSDPINLVWNQTISPEPSLTSLDLTYCQEGTHELMASSPACEPYGPATFNYAGPVVGFDGFQVSGEYPTVEVTGLGGLIDSVAISITWQKKDGGDVNSCGVADGGARPWNDEVSFSIVSPEGISISLLREGTYAAGDVTSGLVTTIFTANGTQIPSGSTPASGSFKANGDLSQLNGRIAQGTWTLIANDNYIIDPLCVSGFAVIVKTIDPVNPPIISWYSEVSTDNLIQSSPVLSVSSSTVGITDYYATNQCEGMCPSIPIKTEVSVSAVPELFAYQIDDLLITNEQTQEIMTAQSLDYSVKNNIYTIFGVNASGNSFSYQVAEKGPMKTPVSLCKDDDFVVFGMGCNGTISWSNGETGIGQLIEVASDYTIEATCNQSWVCTPLSNIPFSFVESQEDLSLSGTLQENLAQDFYGGTIESVQLLKEATEVNYTAPNSILLKPGFEACVSSIFKAEIGNCNY
ncbi:S8 family peptidase [Jiulongibacter sp. NS-SX5]|uniref:S8 family peptidase n=1 Tax=Jiulongibacter sp. NS-SX5 TaxID=3463854 RepID=UPI004057FEA7